MSDGLPPFTYLAETRIDSSDDDVTGGSIPMHHGNLTGISIQVDSNRNDGGNQTLAGTFTAYGSNDPRAMVGHPDYSSAVWVDVSADMPVTAVTSGAANTMDNFSNIRWSFVRFDFAHSSGDGLLKLIVSGHGIGG